MNGNLPGIYPIYMHPCLMFDVGLLFLSITKMVPSNIYDGYAWNLYGSLKIKPILKYGEHLDIADEE